MLQPQPYKLIIAGSRNITDYNILKDQFKKLVKYKGIAPSAIISGGASGVDSLGERLAKEEGIELIRKPADWNKYGKAAGPIRNAEMAQEGDVLLVLWDGKSRGTKNMMQNMAKLNKEQFYKIVHEV